MKMILSVRVIVSVFVFLSLHSVVYCQTSFRGSWNEEGLNMHACKKVLIIGLTGNPDPSLRNALETAMKNALLKKNIHACASFEQYGDSSFQIRDPLDTVIPITEYDAVLCITVNGTETMTEYHPKDSTYRYHDYTLLSGILGSSLASYSHRIKQVTPAYTNTLKTYYVETVFFCSPENTIQYWADTQSVENAQYCYPGSFTEAMSRSTARVVVKDMKKKKLFQKIK